MPKALIVLKPGTTATEAKLLQFCRERLAHSMVPKSVEFLDALPKSGTARFSSSGCARSTGPGNRGAFLNGGGACLGRGRW